MSMLDVIPCPFCPRKLQVPAEVLGQQVRCPSCGQTFVAGEGTPEPQPPTAPDMALAELYEHVSETQPAAIVAPLPSLSLATTEPSAEPEPWAERPPHAAGNLATWQDVRQGINLMYHGLVVGGLTMLAGVCAGYGFSGGNRVSPAAEAIGQVAVGLVLFSGLVSITLHLLGQVYCLRSPLEQRARTLARMSLPLLLLALGLVLLGSALGLANWGGQRVHALGDWVVNLAALCLLVQLIVLLFYLRAIALNLGRTRLASSMRQLAFVIVGIVAAFIGMYLAIVGFNTTGKSIDDIGLVIAPFACVQIVLGLLAAVWYSAVLSELRGVVVSYVRRRVRQES